MYVLDLLLPPTAVEHALLVPQGWQALRPARVVHSSRSSRGLTPAVHTTPQDEEDINLRKAGTVGIGIGIHAIARWFFLFFGKTENSDV